jgi:sugar-specific transcriptional regulator TrmB
MTDELQPTLAELREEREREFDEYEQHLIGIIEQISRDFQRAAAPYVKRLAEIRSVRHRVIVMADGSMEVPISRASPQEIHE